MPRNKIYYGLKDTRFIVNDGRVVLYFSSQFNADRYHKKKDEFIEKFNYTLGRYDVRFVDNSVAQIVLYKQIEKRGFKIEIDGEVFETWQAVKLGGDVVTV